MNKQHNELFIIIIIIIIIILIILIFIVIVIIVKTDHKIANDEFLFISSNSAEHVL